MKIAVALMLPAVFGFLVVRQTWSISEISPQRKTIPTSASDDSRQSGRGTTPDVATVPAAMEIQPLLVRTVPASSGFNAAVESQSSHAPLKLSMAGRAVVEPEAFAPKTLPHRGQQALRNELATVATELDLYGSALRPDNRFGRMEKEVVERRARFQSLSKELANAINVYRQEMRRTGTSRRRQASQHGRLVAIEKLRREAANPKDPIKPRFQPLKNWLTERDDLKGLPLAMGDECRLDASQAKHMQNVSMAFLSVRQTPLKKLAPATRDEAMLNKVKAFDWTEHDVPGLMQVASAEKVPMRLLLVQILSRFQTEESSSALVRIATFDVSSVVREKAVSVLHYRPRSESRDELLAGLRYVWPTAANNAAQALVSLDDRNAYDQLADLARQGDPRAPYRTDENRWAVHELVRVNHMRNCLLCHAPMIANLRLGGSVPSPYESLPEGYYQGSLLTVRADVTYLRQDFSVVHAVKNHEPWPEQQRFDYFVRERNLSDEEAAELSNRYPNNLYPQRAAVLYAMRELGAERSPGKRRSSAERILTSVSQRGD